MSQLIVITGAFGRLGLMCVKQALKLGYRVRCFDIETSENKKTAQLLSAKEKSRIEIMWGDIRDKKNFPQLLKNVNAIIHNAAILPPLSETQPEFAKTINVDASLELINTAQQLPQKPVFIFPSSVTVFGLPSSTTQNKKANDAVTATDNYTAHKIAVEASLSDSTLPWIVLRVGVSVDSRTLSTDKKTFASLLQVKADNPVEWVHPKDVALAMCKAASCEKAFRKTLLIGGGAQCQITQWQFLNAAFKAMGLQLDKSIFQDQEFYTHWMDTTQSQALLNFQQHSFSDYETEMRNRLKWLRLFLKPLSPAINPLLKPILRLL